MAIKNPPIQEVTTGLLGKFPQVWIRWFTSVRDSIYALENKVTTIEDDPHVAAAIAEVLETYGDVISAADRNKSERKFGRNAFIGLTRATVMEQQTGVLNETYLTTNGIDRVVCDDPAFTGTVYIEGHTISGTDLTFTTQTITLNGTTPVALTTPLARSDRVLINNGDALAATTNKIYVYENDTTTAGVPDTGSKVHIQLNGQYNQSQKCAGAVSSTDYFLVTGIYVGALRKKVAIVSAEGQIRKIGDANFKTVIEIPCFEGTVNNVEKPPIFVIPKNHDFRVVATSTIADTEVVASLYGYIASVQS